MRAGKVVKFKPRRSQERRIVAGVDIGASKCACVIAELSGDDPAGQEIDVVGVGFHGMRPRAVNGMCIEQTERNIRRAVDAAESMAGVRLSSARIAAPGRIIRARRIGVDLELPDGVVTQEDVDDCLAEGAELAAAADCDALYANPIAFRLDADTLIDDPVGHAGSVLSTEMLGLSMRASALENLSSLVERCGLTAEEIVPAPIAAAESVLLEDEKELGVVLVDIGAASTDYAVYDNGAVVDCGGVGVGGAHITKDIAQIFGAPLVDAERIKTLHGAALIGAGDEHRFIDFPQLGDGAETARVSRADLSEVIISRLEEIYELVSARLEAGAGKRFPIRRAVVTGGGSLLLGAREVAEKSLSMKARIGRPMAAIGMPEAGMGPGFSVCAGLIQSATAPADAGHFSLGVSRQSRHAFDKLTLFGGAGAWLRAKF